MSALILNLFIILLSSPFHFELDGHNINDYPALNNPLYYIIQLLGLHKNTFNLKDSIYLRDH